MGVLLSKSTLGTSAWGSWYFAEPRVDEQIGLRYPFVYIVFNIYIQEIYTFFGRKSG